jgi:plasmid maintenance system antidote protein VapI
VEGIELFEEHKGRLASPESILEEIESIKSSEHQTSIQMARRMYEPAALPQMLREYLAVEGEFVISRAAKRLGMSPVSLARLLEGRDISENMLFRIEQHFRAAAVSTDLSDSQVNEIVARPWRKASAESTQALIGKVSISLGHLVEQLRASNQVGDQSSAITESQKAQLIAVLESMLAMLRAPAIKADETARWFAWIRRLFARSAERGLEKGISDAFTSAIANGADLIRDLASQPGASDVDKLL